MAKDLILEAALHYRRQFKWSIIPLSAGSKIPPKGFSVIPYRSKLADVSEIINWWTQWPGSNIGIITGKLSNLFVVDIDTEEGHQNINQYIPDSLITPTAETPRGGQHLYFAYPEGEKITIAAGAIPGSDYRGEGGYIVAAPSINGNGKAYNWTIPPEQCKLADLPSELLRAYINTNNIYNNIYNNNSVCVESNKTDGKLLQDVTINLNKGTRDQSLYHVAHTMIKGGASKEDTQYVLNLLAKHCNPIFPENEIVTKCNSAIQRAERKERNLTKEVEEWILLQSCYISVTSCYNELQVVTKEDKGAVRVALNRLTGSLIERVENKVGIYKKIETEFETINFDENEPIEFEYPVKLPLGLNDLAEISKGNIILVAGEFNAGKGHPHGTDILTVNGWRKIEDLKIGEMLFSEDGEKQSLENIFHRGVQDCYKFKFNDGTSIESDSEHIWKVLWRYNRVHKNGGHGSVNKNFGDYELTTTKEIVEFCGLDKITNARRFVIPTVKPINFSEKETIIDPYLIGLLLGDGCLRNTTPAISTNDQEILDSITRCGYEIKHISRCDYRILGLAGKLRKANLFGLKSNNKFIPDEYLYNSIKNRLSILQGLMDTDGHMGKDGRTVEYTTVSKRLSGDVAFLIRSLGGRVTLSEKTPTYKYKGENKTGQKVYRLHIKTDLCPFRLTRKKNLFGGHAKRLDRIINSIKYMGRKETICLKVSNSTGLYVAKDFIVTHNTSFLLNVLKDNKDKQLMRYITSEMSKSEFKKRFATFGLPLSFWKQSDLTDYVKKSSDFHSAIRPDAINIIDYMEFRDSDYTKGAEYLTQIHDKLTTGIAIVAVQKKEGTRMPRSGDMIVEKPRLAISFTKSLVGSDYPQGTCEILKCKMPKVGKVDGKKLRFELQERGSKFFVLNDWGFWRGL